MCITVLWLWQSNRGHVRSVTGCGKTLRDGPNSKWTDIWYYTIIQQWWYINDYDNNMMMMMTDDWWWWWWWWWWWYHLHVHGTVIRKTVRLLWTQHWAVSPVYTMYRHNTTVMLTDATLIHNVLAFSSCAPTEIKLGSSRKQWLNHYSLVSLSDNPHSETTNRRDWLPCAQLRQGRVVMLPRHPSNTTSQEQPQEWGNQTHSLTRTLGILVQYVTQVYVRMYVCT